MVIFIGVKFISNISLKNIKCLIMMIKIIFIKYTAAILLCIFLNIVLAENKYCMDLCQ